jgi:large subunit ribosomal protein L4
MLSVPTVDEKGEKGEKMKLPETIFGVPANLKRETLAVRIYLANQRAGSARTKTRSQVSKTTAKMYKQKGTGRARHGAYSAPIFVGGGIALGPTGEQNFKRKMPKTQIRKTLLGVLSEKVTSGKMVVLSGKLSLTKTKAAFTLVKKVTENKGKLLIIVSNLEQEVSRVFRNVSRVVVVHPEQLNTYQILNCNQVLFTESGLKKTIEIFKP